MIVAIREPETANIIIIVRANNNFCHSCQGLHDPSLHYVKPFAANMQGGIFSRSCNCLHTLIYFQFSKKIQLDTLYLKQ